MKACGKVRVVLLIVLVSAASIALQVQVSVGQTRPPLRESANVSPRQESATTKDTGSSENRYTAGLVSGAPHSTEFATAEEIATAVASGQETGPHGEIALRVMPVVGNSGARNILEVLSSGLSSGKSTFGADMAIAPVIVADRIKEAKTFGDVRDKLVYIAPLYTEEFHLLARPEIRGLPDLAGKKVNLGDEGSAGAVLGREVLNSLDVKIEESNLGLEAALNGMRKGQISATLIVSGKPVNFLEQYPQGDGIHFMPIPYPPVLQNDYLPATLDHNDYATIIPPEERVDTIAIKSALFAYNWPVRSERFRLLELFVQTFFSRISEFLNEAHHPKWREVNLAGRLPGWQRFRPAEQWLQQSSAQSTDREAFGRFLEHNSSGNVQNREQLFQEFLRWRERQQGR